MPVDVAQLMVKINADTSSAEKGLSGVNTKVKESGGFLSRLGSTAMGTFAGFSTAQLASDAVRVLKDQLFESVSAGEDANRMTAILAQGLKSTHDASGQTVGSLDALSTKIMNLSGIDDDAVQGAEQMLLTFTGLGKDVFPTATQAVADMATRINGGAIPSAQQMNSVALQLGKALNDPAKGLSMLTREGVTFTDAQKAQITAMEKAGDAAGAQKLMLAELNKEFGGSAKAAGEANGGMAIMTAQFHNMQQTVGQAIIPILTSLMKSIQPLVSQFSAELPGAIKATQEWFGKNLQPVLDQLSATFAKNVLPALQHVSDAFAPLEGAIKRIAPLVEQAAKLWLDLNENELKITWQLMQDLAPVVGKLATVIVSQLVPVVLNLYNKFEANLLPILQKFGAFMHSTVVPIVNTLANVIETDVIPVVKSLAEQIETKVMPPLQKLALKFMDIASHVLPILNPILQLVGGILKNVVGPALGDAIGLFGSFLDIINRVIDAIGNMLGALGHVKDAVGNALGGLKNIPGIGGLLPHFAEGGLMMHSGLALVGEQGPEVVAMPAGSRIYSHSETAALYPQGGAQPAVIHVHVAPPDMYLDGQIITQRVLHHMPDQVRFGTGIKTW